MRLRRPSRKAAVAAAIALVAIALAARSSVAQNDDLDVLKVIPENYKLIIDNPFVRVLEARIPAGTEERPHRHLKGVSVALTEYTLESRTLPDGQWVRNERKVGTTYWSDASLHQVRNVGTTERRSRSSHRQIVWLQNACCVSAAPSCSKDSTSPSTISTICLMPISRSTCWISSACRWARGD